MFLGTNPFLKTDLSKKVQKLSKNKDCALLKRWQRSIRNHVYWCATSSTSGPEKVAKWTSVVNHLQNVHVHDNSIFPRCEHPDQVYNDPKKWFEQGNYRCSFYAIKFE